jgi:hypothetical protein
MNQKLFIKSGEVAGMIGAMSYMVLRCTPEKSLVQEAVCAIPVVILGGIIGKGVSELMSTPTGIFMSGTFALGLGCMAIKRYCLPPIESSEPISESQTDSNVQQRCDASVENQVSPVQETQPYSNQQPYYNS